ncbi:ATP-grasp fold amidoligase family protein [Anditalea andensis]|nr:ATP-grasp fold amidoligase family protein [Anditalea andensis]
MPSSYSEKIYCRLFNPLPVFSDLADKLKVRGYVEKMIGKPYLIPIYNVFDELTLKDLEALPNSFVLKANHGAGFNRIVADKKQETTLTLENMVSEANEWLRMDYSKRYNERHYLMIAPKLFAEKALLSENKPPLDYKVHVFNNQDKDPFVFIQLMERNGDMLKHFFYLEDWRPAPFKFVKANVSEIDSVQNLTKPKKLKELVSVAKKLASPFSYLRVDLYLFEDRIYFGEMTVTPGAGSVSLSPTSWDKKLGQMFDWPERCRQNIT